MGKKRKKREKNFPRHVVTGVAVTSLAFGVLTNASGFENLFEPQSYKTFEKQQNKKSDYVSGKGKSTDLADKKNQNQKNSGNDIQQALKLANDQMKQASNNSQMKLADNKSTTGGTKDPNSFSVTDKDGNQTIGNNPDNSSTTPGSGDDSSNSDSNKKPSDQTPQNPDNDTPKPGDDSNNDDSKDTPTWEDEQLKPKDSVETKYGTIKKLSATFTKEEYSYGERFHASDAVVIGTFVKDGKTYTQELPYGGEDGYQISFSTNKGGNLTAVFRFGGITTRSPYKVSENHVIINFFVSYDGDYYAAQFKGELFDFLTEDIQNYLTSLNKTPYTFPKGSAVVDLSDMHSRMIAYLMDDKAKESIVKFEGSYRNVNFLEESSDGYLKTMLRGFRFATNKQLIDSQSYIYYPTDSKSWNYSINSKQIVNVVTNVPDEYKIKRITQSEDDWRSYRGDQVLEQYTGTNKNLSVPMGVTKIKLISSPSKADVTTLTLPESITQIDTESVAKYLPDLKEYAYSDPDDTRAVSHVDYKIIDGVLYSADGSTLLSVPAGRTKKLVIPSTVTTLAKDCFKNLSLDKIYFEDDNAPTLLGDTGYHGTIVVPSSDYDHICKNYMFSFKDECNNIDFVSSNQNDSLYHYDKETNTISLKDDKTTLCAVSPDAKGLYQVDAQYNTIAAGAFYGNTSITDIEFSKNIKHLNKSSLVFSNKISSILTSSSDLEIDPYVFGDPSDGAKVPNIKFYVNETDYSKYLKAWKLLLDPVYGKNTAKNILSVSEDNIVYEDGAKYQKYKDGSKTRYRLLSVYETGKTSFKIKNGTTQIADSAFEDCKKLEILYLPSTLQSLNKDILSDCDRLETIINNAVSLKSSLSKDFTELSVFHIGTDYQGFVYEDGVVYGQSLDSSYTLLNVPTDFTGDFILKNNTTKLYDKALSDCNKITSLVISDTTSLKEIGASCFEGNTAIDKVDLSECTSLSLIGQAAFKDCTKLNDVKLPDQLKTLEAQTFYGCVGLENINAKGIESIKDEAFAECLSLIMMTGFDSLKTIGDLAFYDCQSMQTFSVPESTTKIGEECFENCLNLRAVVLKGSVSAISRYCFYGCEKLADISTTEQQKSSLKIIGVEAFAECSNLKNPDFSDFTSLTEIGEGAFMNCSEMVSIKLPKSLEKIHTNCFSGCNNLSAMQLNSQNIVSLDDMVFGDEVSHYLHILVSEDVLEKYTESYQKILDPVYGDGTAKKLLNIIDPNTEYLKGVQYELTDKGRILKNVSEDYEGEFTVLEDTIKIDADAFKNCSKLTKLTIPQDATVELGDRCFKGCSSLKEIYLYGNIPVWGDETFMDCISLEKITVGYSSSEIPRIGRRAFKGCSGLSDVSSLVISAHVNTIGEEAFMDCTNLPAIGFTINSTNGDARKFLNVIEASAFENCKSLVTFLTSTFSGVTTLGDYAFKGCSSLKQPSLAASVTSIGKGCFMDCSNLLYVSFYGAVKEYPEDCFRNCPKLIRTGGTALAFSSLQKVGDNAYEGCTSLTSSTSWYLGRYSNLREIGNNAFNGCKNLAASELSSTVSKIGAHAFDHCTNMKSLTFKSTTPPEIGIFSPDTMMNGFLLKVPDSMDENDKVYKAYLEQLTNTFGSKDPVYPILDSVSDGAKDRNTTKATEEEDKTNTESDSQNNEGDK